MNVKVRQLEVIFTTKAKGAEVFGLSSHYNPELKKGGPGAQVSVSLEDNGGQILAVLRKELQADGLRSVILLREK